MFDGQVAAIIHDPVMSTLQGVRIMRHKFFHQIAAFEGNIDKWAVTKCQRQFRHRRGVRLKKTLDQIKLLLNEEPRLQLTPTNGATTYDTYKTVFQLCKSSWDALPSSATATIPEQDVLAQCVAYRLGLRASEFKYFRFSVSIVIRSWLVTSSALCA